MNKQTTTATRQRGISRGWLAVILTLAILIIDQVIKIEVKTNMCLHQSIRITDWFYINFIENSGMAYGMTFINKLVLSLFRIVAVSVIGYYLWKQVKEKARYGYIVCLAMILAGAAGNIFDSMFYGLCFNASSPYYVSYFVPFGQGYAPFLMGKVVDMFYFPIIDTYWPQWMPFVGGDHFIFFSPVFNFADACISVGVIVLLLFYRRELGTLSLKSSEESDKDKNEEQQD
ncbi:MAG: lipoprotein signal peptidase [Prevotella sp.]|nr:lipoprotein signal peptidase [Prevotella sp.]MBQ6657973.1 lipoprotein signal peptidase [Prevotella sp.]MBQ9570921.1 lipoprotein signal peptidase [Prevotella sp.]